MLQKIFKKAVEITDYVLAWGCLLAGAALVGLAILGILLPLVVAGPLLALAAAYFERQVNDRSILVAAPA